MSTLFALAAEYRSDVAKLGDLDLDDATLADTLESVAWPITVKARNIGALVNDLETQADAVLQYEARVVARRKSLQARAKRLREYLLAGMQAAGVDKIEHPECVVSVRKNPVAVNVFAADQLPAELLRTPPAPPPEPDKAAIKARIQAGEEVPGARLTVGYRVEVK